MSHGEQQSSGPLSETCISIYTPPLSRKPDREGHRGSPCLAISDDEPADEAEDEDRMGVTRLIVRALQHNNVEADEGTPCHIL